MMSPNLEHLERQIETASKILSDMEVKSFQDERVSELSIRQMIYLITIISLDHPTFKELASKMGVSKPSVTANVGALIGKGYVSRVQDHEDLRAYHIVPTLKGEEFNRLHRSLHRKLAQRLAARLEPDEVDQLASLLEKALRGLK
jgi:DNA-binding MarR family transcriptional regulator